MRKIIFLIVIGVIAGIFFYAQCPRCQNGVNDSNAGENDDLAEAAKLPEISATKDEVKVDVDGAKVGVWTMDFDAAKILAAEKKLPLILNFTGSDWCGWCKLMDRQVFIKDEWQKFAAANAVLVYLNFPQNKKLVPEKYFKQNDELRKLFSVAGFPTYVVLASDATTELGKLGADQTMTPSRFIKDFQKTVELQLLLDKLVGSDKTDYDAAVQKIADLKKEADTVLMKLREEAMKKQQEYQQKILDTEKEIDAILDRVRNPVTDAPTDAKKE